MKIIALVVSFALFAFCVPAPLRASGLTVEKWKYDPETKNLSLKFVNTSGKLILGYGWSVIQKFADGSTDALPDGRPSGRSEENMLAGLIDEEMRKGTPSEGMFADSIGLRPEAIKYETRPVLKDVVDVKVIIDYVIYADATAEVENKDAFQEVTFRLKVYLADLEQICDIIRQALANPADSDPVGTARVELSRLSYTLMRKGATPCCSLPPQPDGYQLGQAVSDLENLRNGFGLRYMDSTDKDNLTPRQLLERYLAQTEKHIALLLPYTQITPTFEK